MTWKRTMCLGMALTMGIAGCAEGTGQSGPTDVEAEARQFMEEYLADFRAGEYEAVIARYHRDGAWRVGHGVAELAPFDTIGERYRQGGGPPAAFEMSDLAFEVLGDDAVVVVGTFRAHWQGGPETVTSYTGLLVRQDGELRIRLEDESSYSPRSFTCETNVEDCEHPLDPATAARFFGEYESGAQRMRVFEENGHTMIEPRPLPPMRMLYDGNDEFRLAGNPSYIVRFEGSGPKASSITVFQGVLVAAGRRVE